MVNYNKRLVEVDEILNYLSEEDLSKIPNEVKQLIKENKDKEYKWKYDNSKELKEQDVSRDTIAILSYLNTEYLLNESQKEFVKKMHQINEQKLEEEKSKLYNPNDLFTSNKERSKIESKVVPKQMSVIEYKESFISKIKKFFRNLFNIKNKQNLNINQSQPKYNIKEQNITKNDFKESLNINSDETSANKNQTIEKDTFLKQINGNEKALRMLSIDRLKKLREYYSNIIKENEEKIKKLKASNSFNS